MKRWLLILVPMCAFALCGCHAGETPVQTYETGKQGTSQDGMSKAVNENPNMPEAAKKAVTGQK